MRASEVALSWKLPHSALTSKHVPMMFHVLSTSLQDTAVLSRHREGLEVFVT